MEELPRPIHETLSQFGIEQSVSVASLHSPYAPFGGAEIFVEALLAALSKLASFREELIERTK